MVKNTSANSYIYSILNISKLVNSDGPKITKIRTGPKYVGRVSFLVSPAPGVSHADLVAQVVERIFALDARLLSLGQPYNFEQF